MDRVHSAMSDSTTLIPLTGNPPLKTTERFPALSILISFSLGILIDAYTQIELRSWIILSVVFSISWVISYRTHWRHGSTVILLLLVTCLGGMRHHEFWFCHSPNHITRIFKEQNQTKSKKQLIRVGGVIRTKPQIRITTEDERFNPNQPTQRTNLILECQELISNSEKIPVSGNIYVTIDEKDPRLQQKKNPLFSVGDVIDVYGELKIISGRDNPTDYDFQSHYRKQQIDVKLFVNSSAAVNLITKSDSSSWNSMRDKIHDSLAKLIVKNTSEQTQSIGLALLLGDRSGLTPTIRKKFSQSGLIHFLAISGLHIGFFTIFIWSICHLVNVPRSVAVFLLLFAIIFYLSIIEIRPPILRAASFCALVTFGLINWRTISALNLVSLSAIIILVINPTDLFDVGTQLSFLAVGAILWTIQQDFFQNPFQQAWVPLRWKILASDPVLQTPVQGFLIRYFRLLYSVFCITLFIWIATAPLVLFHFNLISPIGLLINTLIFPFLFLILLLGYLLIFVGSILPFLSSFLGLCFDYCLRLLLWVVETGSSIPYAHFDLPAPPVWWLLIYYSLIVMIIIPVPLKTQQRFSWILQKLRMSMIPIWIMIGLSLLLSEKRSTSLQCTFVAVNHGISILIETPEGQTILYDAGSMSPIEQTYLKIKKTLLDHGIRRVDLLLISHADRDHFNSASQLISNQYIRAIAFPRSFLVKQQRGTFSLCETAYQQQIPITLIGKGDQIELDSGVTFEVLHPGFQDSYENDNPASLTILISFQGRKILLTGDLEGEGLIQLINQPMNSNVDVLLSPHHGSISANTAELNQWAKPDFVVVSGGKKETLPQLQNVYGPNTKIYSTNEHGAITCLIDNSGKLKIIPFRQPQ